LRNRRTILVLGTAQFVMVLDSTVMNVSISQVVADLKTTVPDVQLKRALLVASGFVLVGLWFARALPGEALAGQGGEEMVVPVVSPATGETPA
jgi:hypothetical protein